MTINAEPLRHLTVPAPLAGALMTIEMARYGMTGNERPDNQRKTPHRRFALDTGSHANKFAVRFVSQLTRQLPLQGRL